MSHNVLCRLHDQSEHAFFISEGSLTIKNDDFQVSDIPVSNLLAGTFELLLSGDAREIPTRKLQIELKSKQAPQIVPFTSVEDMFLEYETGKIANQFFALLIERTNEAIGKFAAASSWQRYEKLAVFFAENIDRLREINKNFQMNAIAEVIKEVSDFQISSYGMKARYASLLRPVRTSVVKKKQNVLVRKAGETICRDGDVAEGIYILLDGKVAVKKGERLLATLELAGEAFGELSLFLAGKRTADALALVPTKYLFVHRDELPQFHRDHPLLFFEIARSTTKRIEWNLQELQIMNTIVSIQIDGMIERYIEKFMNKLQLLKNHAGIPEIVKLTQEANASLQEFL